MAHIYIYTWILLSHEKERNAAICNNMDGSWGHYAKWNKSDRERQILFVITYMWNLKGKTNKCIKQNRLTDVEKQTRFQCGKGRREGQVRGMG